MFPQLARFTDLGLLLLRLMVGLVFGSSGYGHLRDPEARAKSIEMSRGFTIFLGVAEVAGGLGVAFGVLTQLAALWTYPDYVWRDLEKSLRVAQRILGGEGIRLALRPDVSSDEPGHRLQRWWSLRNNEIRLSRTMNPRRACASARNCLC